MKKTTPDGPSAASLRELPEVRFARYRARRNPFASRIAREGIEVAHDGPSTESLAEVPEADFAGARMRRNPYTTRAAESAASLQYGRGRPRLGQSTERTRVKSLRLPLAIWTALEQEARAKHTTVHALLRELVAAHLGRW